MNRTTSRTKAQWLVMALAVCVLAAFVAEHLIPRKATIGGTAFVKETSTGLVFEALVDTGAGRCSVNCLEIQITDEAELPEHNVGKYARVLIANRQGEQAWVTTRLIDYSHIRNVETSRPRYHVNLTLSAAGMERKVSVTLKDRSHMTYPMLIGRNFLKDEFVVDVSRDNPDFPISSSKSN